jgi:hypothetical protein
MRRGLRDLRRRGRKASVTEAAPMTLVVRTARGAERLGCDSAEMPALLMRMSRRLWVEAILVAAASTDVSSVTSIWRVERVLLRSRSAFNDVAAASPLDRSRQPRMMW